jgi:hypothetical protein
MDNIRVVVGREDGKALVGKRHGATGWRGRHLKQPVSVNSRLHLEIFETSNTDLLELRSVGLFYFSGKE